MEPRDVRVLMLHAQRYIQLYIDAKWVGADNTASFQLSLRPQFVVGGSYNTTQTIEEFQYSEAEGKTLASLSREDSNCDFQAVVRVTFTRNREDYSLVFLSGFKVAGVSGNILDGVEEGN